MSIKKTTMTAALVAFAAFAGIAISTSSAQAGPIVPHGHYCLSYAEGGMDCGFTSYAQCEATASGIAAECYGNTARDDERSPRAYGYH